MAKRVSKATENEAAPDVTEDLNGVFVNVADVTDGPLTFQISQVERVLFEARGSKPAAKKVVLSLQGDPERKLVLNKTNLRIIADAWGKQSGEWIGKAFDALLDPNVTDPNGKKTGGVRVKVRDDDEPPF